MSEQAPPLLTALTDERDGLAAQNPLSGGKRGILKRQLAAEVARIFQGIDHDEVFRKAFKITGDLCGAEDVQQSFYRNLICLSEEQRGAIRSFEKYVSASIRNLGVQWRKQHQPPQHESLDDEFAERMSDDFTNRLADEQEIEFMLRQLPEDCREAYVLYFAQDWTAQEVAKKLGINTEALKKRLRKAILILAEARIAYLERRK
jgi:RNA polymerase sigma factor (sigma-70 family)